MFHVEHCESHLIKPTKSAAKKVASYTCHIEEADGRILQSGAQYWQRYPT